MTSVPVEVTVPLNVKVSSAAVPSTMIRPASNAPATSTPPPPFSSTSMSSSAVVLASKVTDATVTLSSALISSSVMLALSTTSSSSADPPVAVMTLVPAPLRSIWATKSFISTLPALAVRSTSVPKSTSLVTFWIVNVVPAVTSPSMSTVAALLTRMKPLVWTD